MKLSGPMGWLFSISSRLAVRSVFYKPTFSDGLVCQDFLEGLGLCIGTICMYALGWLPFPGIVENEGFIWISYYTCKNPGGDYGWEGCQHNLYTRITPLNIMDDRTWIVWCFKHTSIYRGDYCLESTYTATGFISYSSLQHPSLAAQGNGASSTRGTGGPSCGEIKNWEGCIRKTPADGSIIFLKTNSKSHWKWEWAETQKESICIVSQPVIFSCELFVLGMV